MGYDGKKGYGGNLFKRFREFDFGEWVKNKGNAKHLLVFTIAIILIILFCIYIYSKPLVTIPVGKLEKPRVCFNAVSLDADNIAFLGGYNKDEIFNTAEIYNLKTGKTKEIFKSNFNNKYGNLLVLSKNDKDEEILINIQPIQFDANSKYGIEIYNLKTKKLEKLDIPLTKRMPDEKFRYSTGISFINILDDTESTEEINYKNRTLGVEKITYKKQNYNLKNFGISDKMVFGGTKNGVHNKIFKPFYSVGNLDGKLKISVENPEVYELKSSFWKDKCSEYLIVDKNNIKTPIQSVLPYYPAVEILDLPVQIKGAVLKEILPLDMWNILLVFEKNDTKYFVTHTNDAINLKLRYMGKVKSKYKNQKYAYFDDYSYEIMQIGGIKSKTPFICGDKIEDNMQISRDINKFSR